MEGTICESLVTHIKSQFFTIFKQIHALNKYATRDTNVRKYFCEI